jgi:hypothetical protein
MYLSAQRVVSGQNDQGLNAYCYLHGSFSWNGLPPPGIPDQNPGELVDEAIELPGVGHRVRSYIDIVAPDATSHNEIRQSFVTFVAQAQRRRFPWVGIVGRCLFRVEMEAALASQWRQEIARLYRAALAVRAPF